jgi:hypothetical protein
VYVVWLFALLIVHVAVLVPPLPLRDVVDEQETPLQLTLPVGVMLEPVTVAVNLTCEPLRAPVTETVGVALLMVRVNFWVPVPLELVAFRQTV